MLNGIKIGPKLIGGFVLVLLIAAGMGLYGIVNIKTADDADTMLFEKGAKPFEYVVVMTEFFQRIRVNSRDVIRAQSPDKVDYYINRIKGLEDTLNDAGVSYEKTLVTEAGKKTYAEYTKALEKVYAGVQEIEDFVKHGKTVEAYAYLDGEMKANALDVQNLIAEIVGQKINVAKKISDENTVRANTTVTVMLWILVIGILVGLGIAISLTLSITKPLTAGVNMMQELAKGHLGTRLKMNRTDEVGVLAGAMDGFADDLQGNVVAALQKVADGDLSSELKSKDTQDEISPAIMKVVISLRGLVAEAGMLRKAAIDGRLATRGNAANFKGFFVAEKK